MSNDTSKVDMQNPDEGNELSILKRHAGETLASDLLASSEDFGLAQECCLCVVLLLAT